MRQMIIEGCVLPDKPSYNEDIKKEAIDILSRSFYTDSWIHEDIKKIKEDLSDSINSMHNDGYEIATALTDTFSSTGWDYSEELEDELDNWYSIVCDVLDEKIKQWNYDYFIEEGVDNVKK